MTSTFLRALALAFSSALVPALALAAVFHIDWRMPLGLRNARDLLCMG